MRPLKITNVVLVVLLLSVFLVYSYGQTPMESASASGPSYQIAWEEGSNFQIVEFWNAPGRRDCEYAGNPWPQAAFAAERPFVLGVRSVFRDEWDINSWIAANRASNSQARIHGAESNCPGGHIDYPPHVHIFYRTIDSGGNWAQINSHHYPDNQGKIFDNFVIPNLCGQFTSYHQPAGAWLDILDETCSVAWQQRYTSSGDIQLRRSANAAVYTLHSRNINGDLAGVDVSSNGNLLYSIDVTEYDALGFRMTAVIKDFQKNRQTTEHWIGDPARAGAITSHTTDVVPLGSPPASTPTPARTPRPTPSPGPTPIPTPGPVGGSNFRVFLPMLFR